MNYKDILLIIDDYVESLDEFDVSGVLVAEEIKELITDRLSEKSSGGSHEN